MSQYRAYRAWGALAVVVVLGVASKTATAAGFALIEQSVSGLGNAFAGGAAGAEDASTVYFNPAGLTRLPGTQLLGGIHVLQPGVEFRNGGSRTVFGTPLTGSGIVDNAGETGVVPNLYLAHELSDRISLGLGINAPFGLSTSYDAGWVGRYDALDSELRTVNINPALAYRVADQLSVGVGFDVQYIDAKLTKALDFGTICVGAEASQALPPGACTALGLLPQQADGAVKVTGDDWGFGYNLGVLYEPRPGTRLGLAYRSKISQELDGSADFTVPANASILTAGGRRFVDTGARAAVSLPETVSLSAYHLLADRWAVMGDITWTHWGRFDELRIVFDNPAQPDSVQPENWRNTYRFSLGASYYPNERWIWRGGIAYDETPVPDPTSRTPRIPDNNRRWLAFGVGYRPSPRLGVDFAYAHLFVNDVGIDHVDPDSGSRLVGEYRSEVDILSAQLGYRFD